MHRAEPRTTLGVRADIERYVRWLQDVRRFQPSTVSRRLSVVVGFYRICVIDAILPHSPADYVRRPVVPNGEFDWAPLGPQLGEYSDRLHERADTFLFGRGVWELMASYWPHAESMSDHEHDLKFAPIWRETPKIVFSRTLEKADWNTRVIGDDLPEEVAAPKRHPARTCCSAAVPGCRPH